MKLGVTVGHRYGQRDENSLPGGVSRKVSAFFDKRNRYFSNPSLLLVLDTQTHVRLRTSARFLLRVTSTVYSMPGSRVDREEKAKMQRCWPETL